MRETVPQTVAFSPFRFPLRWADDPGAVPYWDASRGFPVQIAVKGADDLPPERVAGWVAEGWEPPPPPDEEGGRYPRLVRAALAPLGPVGGVGDVVNDLARLGRYLRKYPGLQEWLANPRRVPLPPQAHPGSRLRREVLKLGERYGFPESPAGNGLYQWLRAGEEVEAHLRAMLALGEDEGRLDLLRDGDEFPAYVHNPARAASSAPEFRQGVAQWLLDLVFGVEPYQPWRRYKDSALVNGEGYTHLLAPRPDAVRGTLGFDLHAGALIYARYLLALRWLGRAQVKRCAACGAYFMARPNATVCRPACRSSKKRAHR